MIYNIVIITMCSFYVKLSTDSIYMTGGFETTFSDQNTTLIHNSYHLWHI